MSNEGRVMRAESDVQCHKNQSSLMTHYSLLLESPACVLRSRPRQDWVNLHRGGFQYRSAGIRKGGEKFLLHEFTLPQRHAISHTTKHSHPSAGRDLHW